MHLSLVALTQVAAMAVAVAMPQQPQPAPDTPLPPGAVPDTPGLPPGTAPSGGATPGPGGATMTVDSQTMVGPGCPIGAGGLIQEMREGLPVFLFTEWNLDLGEADPMAPTASTSKFCQQETKLSNGPVGMQFRIDKFTIGGWADLKAGSKIGIDVETRLGDLATGVRLKDPI